MAVKYEIPLELRIAVKEFDQSVCDAIDAALANGVPLGILVGLLHGHTHAQTTKMVDGA